MNEQQIEQYFEEKAVDGVLPVEEVERLALAAMGGGDVDAATTGDKDGGDAPGPAEAKPEQPEPKEEEVKEPEPEKDAEPEAEPVIAARDGKNVIPYSELTSAREEAKNERLQREALERELAALRARYEPGENADGGDTPDAGAENDAADKLREDWPEVAEAVDGRFDRQQERIKALEERLAQLQPATEQLAAERAAAAHFQAITAAHPDAAEIVNSKEFGDWQAGQPGFMRQIFAHVIERGTTEQVIELLDGFKAANPAWGKPATKDDAAAGDNAARQAAVAAAKEKAATKSASPKSLSDIPGSEALAGNRYEEFNRKTPEEQLRYMQNMSPEQIDDMVWRA